MKQTSSVHAVAVIPARYGSTRFPGKALARIAGKPMVQHVYERVSQTAGLDRVIVATDDARIAQAVEGFRGHVELTGECRTGTDRVCEVVRELEADIILNVQGDEPLIEPACLEALLEAFGEPGVEMATLRRKLTADESADPNVVKVVCARNGDALYFSRASIPYVRSRPTAVFAHVGVYAYRKPCLLRLQQLESTPLEMAENLEQLRALENGIRIRVVETEHRSLGVDTPEDLERVVRRMSLLAPER